MGQITLITLPIGNIQDITFRAKEALIQGSFFLAEDTRVFRSLLKLLDIDYSEKKIISFHEHSTDKIDQIIRVLDDGQDICLVSDAGSPVVSDPAYPIIKAAVDRGHELQTCPGVSSVLAALELSALPPYPFHFHGFIAREDKKKKELFELFLQTQGTHIFFEAPTRVIKTLDLLIKNLSNVDVVVARELTKKFESAYRFNTNEGKVALERIVTKGEFVILLHIPKDRVVATGDQAKLQVLAEKCLESGGSKQLSKLLSEILNRPAKEIYNQLAKN